MTNASVELYKVTDTDGRSYHGGKGKWTKNRWRSVRGELVPCENGLHLARRQDLLKWLGPVIWRAEYDGELIEIDDKVVVRRARVVGLVDTWNERTARLFAADCAEYALQYASDDARPTLEAVIYTVRCYAEGQATKGELWAASSDANSAAYSAASSAANSAAYSAAYSAAEEAAYSAAEEAARLAARSAARSAAEEAPRLAARLAARSTYSAALLAAYSAAYSTLTDRLFDYLEGRA